MEGMEGCMGRGKMKAREKGEGSRDGMHMHMHIHSFTKLALRVVCSALLCLYTSLAQVPVQIQNGGDAWPGCGQASVWPLHRCHGNQHGSTTKHFQG